MEYLFGNQNKSKLDLKDLRMKKSNESTLETLQKMKERAERLNKMKKMYKYRPISQNLNTPINIWNHPQALAVKNPSDSEKQQELIRMAKILAHNVRLNRTDEEYAQERDNFMRQYSSQISKYNLYTKLNEVFNLFSDPNYSEPAFDKDSLNKSATENYLSSLNRRIRNENDTRKMVRDFGGIAPLTAFEREHIFYSEKPGDKGKKIFVKYDAMKSKINDEIKEAKKKW